MVKKGFMKTVEATIAVVVFLIFLAFLSINQYQGESKQTPQEITLLQDTVFSEIQSNEIARGYALNGDEDSLHTFVGTIISTTRYNYNITACNTPNCAVLHIDTENQIYADTLVISNTTKTAYLTLYLWQE